MRERKASNITVTTVDLDKLVTDHQGEWQTFPNLSDFDDLFFKYKLAFVEILADGLFCVNDDGIGTNTPVTDDDPLEMYLFGQKDLGDGKKTFSMFPVDSVKFTPDILKRYAAERIPLEEFIRTFGRRLEDNYALSLEFFRSKGLY